VKSHFFLIYSVPKKGVRNSGSSAKHPTKRCIMLVILVL